MRKLAILTVALLPLLGGCVSDTCDYPTATIHWRLQSFDGSQRSCLAASGSIDPDIAWVDVYIGSATPIRSTCADGGMVIDTSRFAPGAYPTTVEGIGTDGVTIYDRAQFSLTVSECGNRDYFPVLAEGLLNVDYHFGVPGTASDVCHGGSMWFALYDEVAQGYITVVDFNSSPAWREYYTCPANIEFAVPYGTYTLDWIQEVVDPVTAPNPVQQACRQPSLDVGTIGTTTYPVTLAPWAGDCL